MKRLGNKIIYEIYPSSFYDSNNDGIGDINGICQKLDYLQELGIDLIWITPIFKSPKNDNGYDVSNYFEIDPSFGTMEDVDNLIKKAKQKNIGIMFDMVFNHVSTESEWFKKALKNNKKYLDYFYIIKSKDQNLKPNNWVSKFGGSAWEYQKEFDGYYLHLFDKTQADLNWNNIEVRKQLIDVINFWINKGIKGFRFDVINLIGKPNEFKSTADFGKSLYTDNQKVHQYLKELNLNSFGKDKQIITVGEMSSTSIENCIKYSNPQENELDMTFSFHHLKVDYKNNQKWENQEWDIKKFKEILIEWQTKIYENNGWNAVFLNNHDQPRVNTRYGDTKNFWFESSTLFATLIFTLKGTPFIYQGEEIGMTNPDFDSINQYKDVESINVYDELVQKNIDKKTIIEILKVKSRDNSRTPMQWDDSTYGGFSKNKPWIELAYNFKDINVKKQINDKNSVFNYYKNLIKLKKQNLILDIGDIKFIDNNICELFEYERKFENKKIKVLLNLSSKTFNQNIDKYLTQKVLISNYKNLDKNTIKPYMALVVEEENV